MKKISEEIAKDLLPNLRTLADQLARKPKSYTQQWAKSITDSFTLYTRTSTINYFLAINEILHEYGWPFPAYIDFEQEMEFPGIQQGKLSLLINGLLGRLPLGLYLVNFCIARTDNKSKALIDWYLCKSFHKAAKGIFDFWQKHPLLKKKNKLLNDVYLSYKKQLWGVCIPSMLPLLDFLMRDYFHSNDLRDSVGTLVDAFELAGITSSSLKPGSGIWESLKKNPGEIRIADKVEEDLRLPGIYLTSFIDFAQHYYSWHTVGSESKELNRHAIIHGDALYWSKVSTVKFLMFFDLALKLEPAFRIIIKE